MFSSAKAIFSTAFVFAVGGALVATPLHQPQGTVLGADAEAMTPTRVTGTVIYAPRPCTEPDAQQDGAVLRLRNRVCSPMSWVSSDLRLSGTVTLVESEDVYETDEGVVSVTSVAEFVSNDEGGWVCSGRALYEGSGDDGAYVGTPLSMCSGQDGYEGLSAVLVFDTVELAFEGLMFAGDVPPVPERPAAE
jgi:hypothetical protein